MTVAPAVARTDETARRQGVDTSADGIVAALAERRLAGPVIVVADDAAIAGRAPAWAAAFAAAGMVHRVVVAGVDVAAAAAGLEARCVVVACPAAHSAARVAADALGLPLVDASGLS